MYHQRKRKSLYNDKRVNSSRVHKINMYIPNNKASIYEKQKLIEVEGDRPTTIVKILNTSLKN